MNETVRQTPAARRVILIGASNLTRGLPVAINTARNLLGGPIEVFAALGHGRSYGIASRVFGRTLPGILDCGLWEALQHSALNTQNSELSPHSALGTPLAVITDIGNDIMYDQPPAAIATWVEACVTRLHSHNARVAITQLPLASIRALRPWKYRVLRSVLFPTRHLPFDEAMKRLNDLHERLVEITARFDLPLIELPPQWYGVDPIHMRRRAEPDAWLSILASAFDVRTLEGHRATSSLGWRWRCHRMRPESWRFLGAIRHREQPTARLSNESTISLY